MSSAQAAMVESVAQAFEAHFGSRSGLSVVMAPGRVNLIGEHTDHNDGFVLPMTVNRGIYMAIRRRSDKRVRLASVRYNETVDYDLDELIAPVPGHWSCYVLGVVEELRRGNLLEFGFEAVVTGDLNPGAGLSSSAALEVATALALQQLAEFKMDPVDMVKLCQHVEHSYANVQCGIMDQFACRLGKRGHALFLDCRSLAHEHVPLALGEHCIVIVNSGVKRSLATSAYNVRRAECQEAVEFFARHHTGINSLRDVSSSLFDAHADELPPTLRRRCAHVISENQRVLDAVTALATAQWGEFGRLMTASHVSLRDDFAVSCEELDVLVELANASSGVLGSRMTGGGFGGCTVSLVQREAIAALAQRLESGYSARFGQVPELLILEDNYEAGPITLEGSTQRV